jgi:RNA polymerase sigma-70 factor (ECF subfamily)
MSVRDLTLTDVDRLEATTAAAIDAFQMDEDTFRAFYERTARPVWAYLSRLTGSAQAADDLLQETYYRFLRAERAFDSESHRRNYLFRIATNLVRDGQRRRRVDVVAVPEADARGALRAAGDVAEDAARRTDLSRAMAQLKPRERDLLWLAYAHGSSHEEIADSLGLKTASIKLLLFRARRHLASVLRSVAHSGACGHAGTPAHQRAACESASGGDASRGMKK